jgi:hypothetical protein
MSASSGGSAGASGDDSSGKSACCSVVTSSCLTAPSCVRSSRPAAAGRIEHRRNVCKLSAYKGPSRNDLACRKTSPSGPTGLENGAQGQGRRPTPWVERLTNPVRLRAARPLARRWRKHAGSRGPSGRKDGDALFPRASASGLGPGLGSLGPLGQRQELPANGVADRSPDTIPTTNHAASGRPNGPGERSRGPRPEADSLVERSCQRECGARCTIHTIHEA